jgi:hypothetical protein
MMLSYFASALAANLASEQLRERPLADQLLILSAAIGEGCVAEDAYYMGIGEAEGSSKDIAFWSVRCSDGRSFALTINPDAVGSGSVLECETLKAVANQGCFEPLKQ